MPRRLRELAIGFEADDPSKWPGELTEHSRQLPGTGTHL
jgi:hypothetical protein